MIAEIPSIAFEVPEHALWDIGGFVLTVLISGFSGYRWGLRSQKQAAKLSARNAVCAVIDRIAADLWDNRSMWGDESKSKTELSRLTLEFSCQFSESDRVRIKKFEVSQFAFSSRRFETASKCGASGFTGGWVHQIYFVMTSSWPNQSPEPTAVVASFCFSEALSPPWLSFGR